MFEKNIKELEKKNPELAKKLKDYPYSSVKTIEVFDTESKNLIISYKGTLLHSNEDPVREAKSIWFKTVTSDLKSNDIQIVYGLGLGYLFKRAYVNAKSRVVLFEPELDILRFVFENVDLSNELGDDRVFVFDNQEDIVGFFESKYLAGDKIEVLFLPSYVEVNQKELLNLSNNLFQTVKDRNIDQNTAFMMSKLTVPNLISRVSHIENFKPVNCLENAAEGKTALIISAGPSLTQDLDLIKKNREKFVVIAILPTLALLKDNGIEPDFVTVVDPIHQIFKIERCLNQMKNVNLVLESKSDIGLDSLDVNSFFVYFSELDKISESAYQGLPNCKIKPLPPCASVAIMSFRLAKLLGCKNIIFSGLDLAIPGDKPYADESFVMENESDKLMTISASIGSYSVVKTKTKSANGQDVKTREDYLIFIREFEKIAKENADIKMVNTALNGAFIDGMIYQSMEDTLKPLENVDFDAKSVIENIQECDLKEFKGAVIKKFVEAKNSYKYVKNSLKKALAKSEIIFEEFEKEKPDFDKVQQIYQNDSEAFSTSRVFPSEDLILSSYLQAEIAEFVSSYNKDSQLTIDKIKENISIEKKFFEKTLQALDYLTKTIDNTIKQG